MIKHDANRQRQPQQQQHQQDTPQQQKQPTQPQTQHNQQQQTNSEYNFNQTTRQTYANKLNNHNNNTFDEQRIAEIAAKAAAEAVSRVLTDQIPIIFAKCFEKILNVLTTADRVDQQERKSMHDRHESFPLFDLAPTASDNYTSTLAHLGANI